MLYTPPIYELVWATGRLGHGDFIEVEIQKASRALPGGRTIIYVSRKFLK